jgi:hypothetical protein
MDLVVRNRAKCGALLLPSLFDKPFRPKLFAVCDSLGQVVSLPHEDRRHAWYEARQRVENIRLAYAGGDPAYHNWTRRANRIGYRLYRVSIVRLDNVRR